MKPHPFSYLDWEVASCTLDLQACPKAFCVIHSWAPTLFGPILLSSPGSKKRLHPQCTWKVVCVGATWLDGFPVLGLGCRAPGAKGEDSPMWVYGESLDCHQLL
jgi:hypothetical protein